MRVNFSIQSADTSQSARSAHIRSWRKSNAIRELAKSSFHCESAERRNGLADLERKKSYLCASSAGILTRFYYYLPAI